MSICFNHIYFRPKISAACFKISFSILNCWFSFRSRISSSCSGVRLSFSWKEPELDACFTHLSNREVAMSYSRQISHLRLPEQYSSTSSKLLIYNFGLRLPFGLRLGLQPSPPNRLIKFLFVGSRTLLHHFLHPYHYWYRLVVHYTWR